MDPQETGMHLYCGEETQYYTPTIVTRTAMRGLSASPGTAGNVMLKNAPESQGSGRGGNASIAGGRINAPSLNELARFLKSLWDVCLQLRLS